MSHSLTKPVQRQHFSRPLLQGSAVQGNNTTGGVIAKQFE